MSANRWIVAAVLACVAAMSGIAGCGGSRNSSDSDDAPDFSLGNGDVKTKWSSGSTELVHNLSRHALYYLDQTSAGSEVVAINVANGDDSTLVQLFLDASKMRLTADQQNLYILESSDSAQISGGLDLVRYDIGGNFIDLDSIVLSPDRVVADFAPTNNFRVVVASYERPASGVTPSVQWLSLFSGESGALFDEESFVGVTQQLALNRDQVSLLDQVMAASRYQLLDVSVASESVAMTDNRTLLLGEGADNTYEPEGDRIFRSNGTVWDDNDTLNLGTSYDSIDFDLDGDRIVILTRGSNGFLIRYFDIDSLELLGEQPLPAIGDAAGMDPVKVFVDDGELYVVYREISSDATKDYVLVEFEYPR